MRDELSRSALGDEMSRFAAYQEAARVLRAGGKLLTVSHSSRQVVIESLGLPFRVREERTWNVTAQEATEDASEKKGRVHISARARGCGK